MCISIEDGSYIYAINTMNDFILCYTRINFVNGVAYMLKFRVLYYA